MQAFSYFARRAGACRAKSHTATERLRDPAPLPLGEAMQLVAQQQTATNDAATYHALAKLFALFTLLQR